MLTFAQPLFLLALGGLVLPFLIHRISRAQPVAWRFPSIARIRKTPLPRQGRRSITDWLLLLLRMSLLALLIIGLAGPVWNAQAGDSAQMEKSTAQGVIVLDYSSSMSGWNAINETREILRTLEAQVDIDWSWIVASNEIHAEQSPDPASNDARAIRNLIEQIEQSSPSLNAGDPRIALSRALEFLQSSVDERQLHIISDFQESDWSDLLPEIPPGVSLQLHRVGRSRRDRNLAIREVIPVPTGNNRLRVISRLMNYGNERATTELRLTTPEGTYSQEAVLDSGSLATVAFELPVPSGQPDAALEIDPAGDDPYPRDNRFEFTASAPAPLDVLSLNLGKGIGIGDEETFFLGQALDTESSREWIRYSVLPVGLDPINPETLSRTSAVFIPSSAFGENSVPWDILKGFINSGGLVVATMGEDALRGLQALRTSGYPAGDYSGLAGRGRGERFFVGPIPENSPLASVFEGPAERDLFLISFRQYIRMTPSEAASSLLVAESGDPLLMSIPIGKGTLVLSTFPWDRSVSDFPLRPSFLPIVREVFSLRTEPLDSPPRYQAKNRVPDSESITGFVDPEQLTTRLRGGRTGDSDSALQVDPRQGNQSAATPLGPWFLLTAMICLVAESLLARRLLKQS